MPRHIETYTKCAGPGVARPHEALGGLAGFIIRAWYFSGVLTVVGGIAFLTGLILATGPLAWCITAGLVLIALAEIKFWYYNERLLCIREDECAIGTVISQPTAATDGDRKLNLMLAPFTQLEIRLLATAHIDRNRAMLSDATNFTDGFHPSGPPTVPTAAQMSSDPTRLQDYLTALAGSDPDDKGRDSNMYSQTLVGVVDTMLLPSNNGIDGQPKNFQARFFRKDPAEITDVPTFNEIPQDFDAAVAWQSPNAQSATALNPQFRFENTTTVPYLHCEIEGNAIAIMIDSFIVAVSAFLVACLIPGIGPVLAAVIGFLAWLFKKFIDWVSGNDGDAAEPDIDWDDPGFTGYPGVTETTGDVVVTHGDWIMDEEHDNYFEIHPVRAYYIIARNALGADAPVLVDGNEEQVVVGDNFDPSQLTSAVADEICAIVSRAEAEDSDDVVAVRSSAALSYGMDTKYGGGQTVR